MIYLVKRVLQNQVRKNSAIVHNCSFCYCFCSTRTVVTKCCFERKGLLGHRLTRKKTGSWDLQSKPPEAGLDGEKTDMSTVPALMGLLCTVGSEKKDVSYFGRIYFGYRFGEREANQGKFRDSLQESSICCFWISCGQSPLGMFMRKQDVVAAGGPVFL